MTLHEEIPGPQSMAAGAGKPVTAPDPAEELAGYDYTSEEIVSLLWLRQWYQTGGSDRVELVRLWEALSLRRCSRSGALEN